MLRLPWPEWGETDVMLGMAAELHDRLVCSCGCGQWEADAHDPLKKHLWRVNEDVCFVRRTIDDHIKSREPAAEVVLSVRLGSEGSEDAGDAYGELVARFPHLAAQREPQPDADRGDAEHGQ